MPDFLSCTLYDVSRSGFSDNADSENISAGTSHHRSADPRSNSEGNILLMMRRIWIILIFGYGDHFDPAANDDDDDPIISQEYLGKSEYFGIILIYTLFRQATRSWACWPWW